MHVCWAIPFPIITISFSKRTALSFTTMSIYSYLRRAAVKDTFIHDRYMYLYNIHRIMYMEYILSSGHLAFPFHGAPIHYNIYYYIAIRNIYIYIYSISKRNY